MKKLEIEILKKIINNLEERLDLIEKKMIGEDDADSMNETNKLKIIEKIVAKQKRYFKLIGDKQGSEKWAEEFRKKHKISI